MKRNTVLLLSLVALAPVALLAATDPPEAAAHPERGWLKRFDTNGDGAVTQDEAQAAANARIEKTFAELDANHDGQITQDEISAAHDARRADMEAKFAARLKQADSNGDGPLSKEEVQAGMPMLSRGFDRLDSNHDGALSVEEIKAGRTTMGRHMRHKLHEGPPGSKGPTGSGG
jgi:hypothetical protein